MVAMWISLTSFWLVLLITDLRRSKSPAFSIVMLCVSLYFLSGWVRA